MAFIMLFLLTWQQISVGRAQKCAITSQNNAKSYLSIWDGTSIYMYKIYNGNKTLFYNISDTIGTFALSSYDSILIVVRKIDSDSVQIIRFSNLSCDTTYSIYFGNPENLSLYNDGHIHPSYPIWYLLIKNDSGIFISHSSNYGTSFYPFDTVLIDNHVKNFDFTTSLNDLGDRLHLVYQTNDSLYLLNGSYPANFNGQYILIDTNIPDTGHFSLYAKYDTIFVAYERKTSASTPDPDIYYAVSFHEGSDSWQYGIVSIDTTREKYPVIIPAKDSIKVLFIDEDSLYISSIPSPYNVNSLRSGIYANNFIFLIGDKTSYFPAILSIEGNGDAYFIYDDTYSFIKETTLHRKGGREFPQGIFTIDGRKIKGTPKRGIYIKNGKKLLIIK